jgi:hypothetical protein
MTPTIGYEYQGFTLQMSNFTDLTFAQADYKPVSEGNTIKFTTQPPLNLNTMTLPLPTSAIDYFETSEFSFGKLYDDDTAYFESINNENPSEFDTEGTYVNATKFETTVNGLALPPQSYVKLVNLLSIASNGQIDCNQDYTSVVGCILPKTCDKYSDLWEYSFKVEFTDVAEPGKYWILPLATIASDVKVTGNTVCKIFV